MSACRKEKSFLCQQSNHNLHINQPIAWWLLNELSLLLSFSLDSSLHRNQDMPLNTENIFWQINLLLLTAFVKSYGTSVIGNRCVASQRITVYQVIDTFVLNLNMSQKSHCKFSYEVTQFTSRATKKKEEQH